MRAVRTCPVPVVTGLGHQVDRTLSDMAADLDAPTPSAAAEALFPDRVDLLREIRGIRARMGSSISREIHRHQMLLDGRVNSLVRSFERSVLIPAGTALERLRTRAATAAERVLSLSWSSFREAASAMDALSPLKILGRGFASCSSGDGRAVSRAAEVSAGDELIVAFIDGRAETTVRSVQGGSDTGGGR
ncbi:MAG TPA: hypothetical protein DIT24_02645 [Synergistaceae bacterium]|nr:hypothetical protein [Synergistaceae bacterium]